MCRADLWKKVLQAVNQYQGSYTGPSYNALRTTLLDKAKQLVEKELLKWRKLSEETGCVLISDGWSDTCQRALINVLAQTPKGPHFIKAVDCSEVPAKNAEYLAELWAEAVEFMGADRVHVIITDSASVNKTAGELLEQKCVCAAIDVQPS